MKRRTFLAASALAALAPVSCRTLGAGTYVLASGETGGFQDAFARLLAAALTHGPIRLQVRNSAGSVENAMLIRSGAVTFGLSLADSAAADPAGLTALGRVYENYVQLAARADSDLASFEDLRGHRVSLGARGSGTEWTGLRVLAAAGLSLEDIELTPVSLTTVRESLSSANVAAAMWAGGVPTPSALPQPGEPAGFGIRLLDLSRERAVMQARFGGIYEEVSVPANMYGPGPEASTIGIPSLLLAAPSAPDAAAEALVDVLVDRPSELIPPGTSGIQFLDSQSLINTYGVPLHPGAVASYRRHHG